MSAFYHDSAAALVVDGNIVAAAQEERFTRVKGDASFPVNSISYCLSIRNLKPADLDLVVYYEQPRLKGRRLLSTFLSIAPRGVDLFVKAVPGWLTERLHIERLIRNKLGFDGRVECTEHHGSHAASAFYPSPFQRAAILTVDGVGELATTAIALGDGNGITPLMEVRFPHSLGLLYSAFTAYLGFRINSGEYKVMGLAPYGDPRYVSVIYDNLIQVLPDGSFFLNQRYFDYCAGSRMTNERFHGLFGRPPRDAEAELTQHSMDVAASIQRVCEEIMLALAGAAYRETGETHLCMAGGVALNCVANGRIKAEGPFKEIWIQPAAGDSGGALGAAMVGWHQIAGNARIPQPGDSMCGSMLGPEYSNDEIGAALRTAGAAAEQMDAEELIDRVVRMIDDGKVVGWFQGRMEFGPRALGARSILGDARRPEMQSQMNRLIKFREGFRPFAPCILREHAGDYFESADESPYMLFVSHICRQKRAPLDPEAAARRGFDALNIARSDIPAATHIDYSARIQTVDHGRHGRLHRLMQRFYERTGCPVVLNTSFNIRGEPIVCTPADAYRCFQHTAIDALAIGDYLLLKADQYDAPGAAAYRAAYGRD